MGKYNENVSKMLINDTIENVSKPLINTITAIETGKTSAQVSSKAMWQAKVPVTTTQVRRWLFLNCL